MFLKIIFMCAMIVSFSTQAFAAIDKFAKVSPGVYRGAQPTEPIDYKKLKQLGIKTIISLRHDGQFEASIAKQYGFAFYWAPMNAFSYPDDQQVDETLSIINNPANQPVFIHCEYGKDRTGLIVGLHRVFHQGWSSQRAYDEMISFGFNRVFVGLLTYYFKKTVTAVDNWIHKVDRFALGN